MVATKQEGAPFISNVQFVLLSFLNGFVQIVASLHDLAAGMRKYLCGDEAHQTLEHLKKSFAHPPILVFPNMKKAFIVFFRC